jgi:hypothetical protein
MRIVGHVFITVCIIYSRNVSIEAEDIHIWMEGGEEELQDA